MMTLSIDLGVGMVGSVMPEGTMSVTDTVDAPSQEPLASDHQARLSAFESAMAKPLMDNAALGDALQFLVDNLDSSPFMTKVIAESKEFVPVAIGTKVPAPVVVETEVAETVVASIPRDRVAEAPVPAPVVVETGDAETVVASVPRDRVAEAAVPAPVVVETEVAETVVASVPRDRVTEALVPAPVVVETEAAETVVASVPRDRVTEAPVPAPVVVETEVAETVAAGVPRDRVTEAPVPAPVIAVPDASETAEVRDRMVEDGGDVANETIASPLRSRESRRNDDSSTSVVDSSPSVVDSPRLVVEVAAQALPAAAESAAQVASAPAATDVSPVDVSSQFFAAAEAVAESVFASPELMRGESGEIRVQLKQEVLQGSVVKVMVDDGKLEVAFEPTTTQVADVIAANLGKVQQQLAARVVGFEVAVTMAQTVATNVATAVASNVSSQVAMNRQRRMNGRI